MDASMTNDIYGLIMGASLPVQIVMGVLLLTSLVSWWTIFMKMAELTKAKRQADEFEKAFWSGGDMNKLYQGLSANKSKIQGMSVMFESGFQEYARSQQNNTGQAKDGLISTRRAMQVALNRELDDLESGLPFLASVGSVSPYIGLLGTVWGIMNAFMGLTNTAQATLTQVAPGIAEALIATAIGLFAAIPAVLAYNRFVANIDRLTVRYESFLEEFTNIIQRRG